MISGGLNCSFSLLHYSSYYTYCLKKVDYTVNFYYCTALPIIRTVLKNRPVTSISTGLIIGTLVRVVVVDSSPREFAKSSMFKNKHVAFSIEVTLNKCEKNKK